MKGFLLPTITALFAGSVTTQTSQNGGIGIITPNAAARPDVAATTQGFFPSRVTLTAGNGNAHLGNPTIANIS